MVWGFWVVAVAEWEAKLLTECIFPCGGFLIGGFVGCGQSELLGTVVFAELFGDWMNKSFFLNSPSVLEGSDLRVEFEVDTD